MFCVAFFHRFPKLLTTPMHTAVNADLVPQTGVTASFIP